MQKRLLQHFKARNPAPLSHLEELLGASYTQLLRGATSPPPCCHTACAFLPPPPATRTSAVHLRLTHAAATLRMHLPMPRSQFRR